VLACRSLPRDARDRVHVIFIGGLDWCALADNPAPPRYLPGPGFHPAHPAPFFPPPDPPHQNRRPDQEHPPTRFAVVGFSLGANMVSTVTRCVKDDGIPIELLVYCGGNTLCNKARDQSDNARHIVNILATGWIFNGSQLDRAENISEPDVFHFGTPSHP